MRLFSFSDDLTYKISRKRVQSKIQKVENDLRKIFNLCEDEELDPNVDFGIFQEDVEEFVRVFKENFPAEQTRKMLYRLNRLTIEIKPKKLSRRQKVTRIGRYNSFQNKITFYAINGVIDPEEKRDVIIHELFHMASSRNLIEGAVSGFDLKNGKNLNEGYTELLRKRYFGNTGVEDWPEIVAKGIENIVGAEKMERYYLTADLPALITELSRYIPREDVMKLIYMIDNVEEVQEEDLVQGFSRKKFNTVIREIADITLEKLNHELLSNKITIDEYIRLKEENVDEYRNNVVEKESYKTMIKVFRRTPSLAYANPGREIEVKSKNFEV